MCFGYRLEVDGPNMNENDKVESNPNSMSHSNLELQS